MKNGTSYRAPVMPAKLRAACLCGHHDILRICLGTQPSFPVIGWVHLIQPIQFGLSSYSYPVIRISPSRNSIELFLLALYPDIVLYDGTWLSSIEGCESLVAEASRINSKILLLQFYLKYNDALNRLGRAAAKPSLSSRACSMMSPYNRSGQISLTFGKYVRYLVTSRVINSRPSTAACAPI